MKDKMISAYMDVAERFAQLSTAQRLHVGAIVVKDDRIISIGYNGMPAGWTNECEHKDYMPYTGQEYHSEEEVKADWPFYDEESKRHYRLKSKAEVLHAERNALDKLARGSESGLGAIMFVTHAPCIECAKSIYGAGIHTVFYRDKYRDTTGLDFLQQAGVKVVHRENS